MGGKTSFTKPQDSVIGEKKIGFGSKLSKRVQFVPVFWVSGSSQVPAPDRKNVPGMPFPTRTHSSWQGCVSSWGLPALLPTPQGLPCSSQHCSLQGFGDRAGSTLGPVVPGLAWTRSQKPLLSPPPHPSPKSDSSAAEPETQARGLERTESGGMLSLRKSATLSTP